MGNETHDDPTQTQMVDEVTTQGGDISHTQHLRPQLVEVCSHSVLFTEITMPSDLRHAPIPRTWRETPYFILSAWDV